MELLWQWLSTIHGETWGAFAGGLVVFVIKVVGPMLTRMVTRRYQLYVQELEALAENERLDPQQEIEQLKTALAVMRLERDRARADLDGVCEDLRAMANRTSVLEQERDEWRARAEANERKGGTHVATDTRGSSGANRAARPLDRVGRTVAHVDHVPTVPPSSSGRRPPKP